VHLDLVGSFTPAMREADAEAVRAALIYVDCVAEALQSGELQGLGDRIAGDLVALARLPGPARRGRDRTLYKSAGFAALDLAAAMLAWEARDG
jgi:ornithine cyclodeaminase